MVISCVLKLKEMHVAVVHTVTNKLPHDTGSAFSICHGIIECFSLCIKRFFSDKIPFGSFKSAYLCFKGVVPAGFGVGVLGFCYFKFCLWGLSCLCYNTCASLALCCAAETPVNGQKKSALTQTGKRKHFFVSFVWFSKASTLKVLLSYLVEALV